LLFICFIGYFPDILKVEILFIYCYIVSLFIVYQNFVFICFDLNIMLDQFQYIKLSYL